MDKDIVQVSFDMVDNGMDRAEIESILEKANIKVVGLQFTSRWSAKDYGYDIED